MRESRIAGLVVLVALATITLPILRSDATTPAARQHRTPPVGKQLAELEGSDTVPGDGFGAPVAVSGSTAVIGAWHHGGAGRAYVFADKAGTWSQVTELKGSDTATGADFGSSVAVSGRTVVIGAPGPTRSAGRAYVFTETNGRWSRAAELKGSDTSGGGNCSGDLCPGGSFFGISVAISGTTAVVGASSQAGGAGRAYVFAESDDRWRQVAELQGSTAHLGAEFGTSVAISGTTVLVGANGDPTGGGRAYVFAEARGAWRQVAVLKGSDTAMNDYFGSDVAVSGTTAVVGAYSHARDAGEAYLFARRDGGWRQVAELGSGTAADTYLFGDSVAVSGRTVVVGANGYAKSAGRAYVFTETRGTWAKSLELVGSDTIAGDNFGCSVAVSGSTAVVGAFNHADRAGGAYVFET